VRVYGGGCNQDSPAEWRRRYLLAVGLVLVGALPARGGSLFSSVLDEFVVLFPVAPQKETRRVDLGEGRSASMGIYHVDEPRTEWLVSATDISRLALDLTRTLSATRGEVVEKTAGTLVSETPVRIAHYEGLELRLARADGSVVSVRICVTPRRIYQVIVMTTEENRRLAQIGRFLETFSPE